MPPMTGGEYLTANVLATLWMDLDAALRTELAASKVKLLHVKKYLCVHMRTRILADGPTPKKTHKK
jgi:hypothetical protein